MFKHCCLLRFPLVSKLPPMRVCREAFLKQAAVKKINCGTCFFPLRPERKNRESKQKVKPTNTSQECWPTLLIYDCGAGWLICSWSWRTLLWRGLVTGCESDDVIRYECVARSKSEIELHRKWDPCKKNKIRSIRCALRSFWRCWLQGGHVWRSSNWWFYLCNFVFSITALKCDHAIPCM